MKVLNFAITVALPLLVVARPLIELPRPEVHDTDLDRRQPVKSNKAAPLTTTKFQNAGGANAAIESIASGTTSPATQAKGITAAVQRGGEDETQNIRGGGAHTSTSSTLLPNSELHVTTAAKTDSETTTTQRHTGLNADGSPTGEVADFPGKPNKGKEKVKPQDTNPNPTAAEAIAEGIKQKAENLIPGHSTATEDLPGPLRMIRAIEFEA